METDESAVLMIMYEDESVDIRYRNGARLQLSPCGSEFLLVKASDSRRHPLQPAEKVRQRTRFTISTYKKLMLAALAFRNKYARQPYLPHELISAENKKPFFSIDSAVHWPEVSASLAEFGLGGETIVRSEEGHAVLVLSSSGEEFTVEFMCSLSSARNQHRSVQQVSRDDSYGRQEQASSPIPDNTSDHTEVVRHGRRNMRTMLTRPRSCSPQMISDGHQKPEQVYQSTTVVQHHSCCAVAPKWAYPLSVARHHWAARFSKAKDVADRGASSSNQSDKTINKLDISCEDRRSRVPQALPLTCPTPHRHRWKVKDPLAKEEHTDLPTEMVKVVWCQGVTYRILSGSVSAVEVSPGDGSVIRSNRNLNSYFTHHKTELQSGRVKEVTYHLNNLPPDVLGQAYSVCSIVSRASRILACYNQALKSLKCPALPSCLQELEVDGYFCKPAAFEEMVSIPVPAEQRMSVTEEAGSLSELVAAELEKIKRFTFLLENSHVLRSGKAHADEEERPADVTCEPLNDNYVAEALQRTSKAIQDIDALVSAATLT
ncbi:uncharacterized protein C5orf34 homolog isoform X1 [Simochromis diagramma]|uniref:uncharacterized protein C5orf34 homolog isoform X1 n=1 Tax=Simochromis diagramma TaxID=43689 RepID=UPI001A7E591A|nr:uncharacterized protein C5orf34 homolog isoform X1 [Simochromis diagramma]